MNRTIFSINNQQGSVMAITLMVMVTLTIIGLMSINDTVMESSIARNHTLYRQTLYLAEAAVRQAAQIMEDYADDPDPAVKVIISDEDSFPAWMRPVTFDFGNADWGDFRAGDYGDFQPSRLVGKDENGEDDENQNINASGFVAKFEGVASGGSLDMTDPTSLYQYSVYGRGVGPMMGDTTRAIVKVGYRMRY